MLIADSGAATGTVTVRSGNASGVGMDSGAVTVESGTPGGAGGNSGLVTVRSGTVTDGTTGGVTIASASSTGTNRATGTVTLQTGTPTGSGEAGDIVLATSSTTRFTVEGTTNAGQLTLGSNCYFQFSEMTAPAAGAANTARLYSVDNGAGKTQLVVIFASGAAQVLATEP